MLKKMMMRWDAKKKKYVKADPSEAKNEKKIKTESGVWIPASYKSDRYAKWRERSKLAQMQEAAEDEEDAENDGQNLKKGKRKQFNGLPAGHPAMKKAKMSVPKHKKGPKMELKRPEQILKQRKAQAKMEFKNKKKGKGKKR